MSMHHCHVLGLSLFEGTQTIYIRRPRLNHHTLHTHSLSIVQSRSLQTQIGSINSSRSTDGRGFVFVWVGEGQKCLLRLPPTVQSGKRNTLVNFAFVVYVVIVIGTRCRIYVGI